MIDGSAGAMEALMRLYAKGKPVERVEPGLACAFAGLSNTELKQRLTAVLTRLQLARPRMMASITLHLR